MQSSIVRVPRSDLTTLKLEIAGIMVTLQLFAVCAGSVMASSSKEEEILAAAVAGIPRVAEAVASIPEEDRPRALDAVEGSYRQTLRELGHEEAPIQGWISAVMFRLRSEVKKQESMKQKMLEALHGEPDRTGAEQQGR